MADARTRTTATLLEDVRPPGTPSDGDAQTAETSVCKAPDRKRGMEDASSRQDANSNINDERFMDDLDQLKKLRSFLLQEAVVLSDPSVLSFGELNLLRFDAKGRSPTLEEWSRLETLTRVLFSSLGDSLRQKFRLASIPWMLSVLPGVLGACSFVALILAIVATYKPLLGELGGPAVNVVPFYLLWLLCMGAIGALAFVGMNALSVQADITFDLTNRRLMALRVILGALFGMVLTLPFGFEAFFAFCKAIATAAGAPSSGDPGATAGLTTQAVTLLMPFAFGFSTSLVILVLNQFVDAVQTFFGRRTSAVPVREPSVSATTGRGDVNTPAAPARPA